MTAIRVFPRRTNATPDDDNVRINTPPGVFDVADEVHISVTFTWDIPRAEWLAKQWERIAPVKIGGPAMNESGGNFVPGMYMKMGYVITSRGCPNNCWFCSVPKREGGILRELPICDGWHVQDDNLLACSDGHIKSVFAMLARQKQPAEFSGGFEAALLKKWHAEELKKLRIKQMFFAYDLPGDIEAIRNAGELLKDAGFTLAPANHNLRCFVLCGFRGDTFEKAEKRMIETMEAGFTPMAMLWRDDNGKKNAEWGRFQREWVRPAIIYSSHNAFTA